jgi:hypothetical protein
MVVENTNDGFDGTKGWWFPLLHHHHITNMKILSFVFFECIFFSHILSFFRPKKCVKKLEILCFFWSKVISFLPHLLGKNSGFYIKN